MCRYFLLYYTCLRAQTVSHGVVAPGYQQGVVTPCNTVCTFRLLLHMLLHSSHSFQLVTLFSYM